MKQVTQTYYSQHHQNNTHYLQSRERGASLIAVLIILVIISLIGVTAANVSLFSSQATRYQRDYLLAYEAAQAAIYDAIVEIEIDPDPGSPDAVNRKTAFTPDGANLYFKNGCGDNGEKVSGVPVRGLCQHNSTLPAPFDINLASSSKAVPLGTFTGRAFQSGNAGLKPRQTPVYIIEALPDVRPSGVVQEATLDSTEESTTQAKIIYRITAMGFGMSSNVNAVIQAEYRKQYIE